MLKSLYPVGICVLIGLIYLTGTTEQATAAKKAVVGVETLNVRDGPSRTDAVVNQVQRGEVFQVQEERYGWLKISMNGSKTGWIAGQFTKRRSKKHQTGKEKSTKDNAHGKITLLQDHTNFRTGPGLKYDIVAQKSQGDHFQKVGQKENWVQVKLPSGRKAFVAGWLVTSAKDKRSGSSNVLNGKTIVIDPGHGGKDSGAKGDQQGTLEKNVTLKTAQTLTDKLQAAGARVILTRDADVFISLATRVQIAKTYHADAFISLHYNASLYPSATGIASYYYTAPKDLALAKAIQTKMADQTNRRDRNVDYGNYHVLRENPQPATLLELGFLSNAREEQLIRTKKDQQNLSDAILAGLKSYFNIHSGSKDD